jgi:hypothetical protein
MMPQNMRYYKAMVTYEVTKDEYDGQRFEQILFCCSPQALPTSEQIRELFYSLEDLGKKYIGAHWHAVREDEIPTGEIHLL